MDQDQLRAQQVESMFGDRAMGMDSFWSAARTHDAKEWARLVRRAEEIEKAMGSDSLCAGSGRRSARPPTASGSARSAASPY